jgi:hypothetical protein
MLLAKGDFYQCFLADAAPLMAGGVTSNTTKAAAKDLGAARWREGVACRCVAHTAAHTP